MTTKLCPLCSKESSEKKYIPFCSKRCADIDLGRWLKGAYVIEGEEEISSDYHYNEDNA